MNSLGIKLFHCSDGVKVDRKEILETLWGIPLLEEKPTQINIFQAQRLIEKEISTVLSPDIKEMGKSMIKQLRQAEETK